MEKLLFVVEQLKYLWNEARWDQGC